MPFGYGYGYEKKDSDKVFNILLIICLIISLLGIVFQHISIKRLGNIAIKDLDKVIVLVIK